MTITLTISGDTAVSVEITSLVRLDTGDDVPGLTLPEAMTDAGGGVWTYTFAEPDDGLTYEYEYLITWDDTSTTEGTGTTEDGGDLPETYSTRGDIEDWFGVDNVAVWADLNDNNDGTEISERIGRARQYAYDLINSRLGENDIDNPATSDILGATDFGLLDDIEAELAGVWLFRARGETGNSEGREGQMQGHWDHAMAELDRIISANVEDSTEAGGISFVPINRGTSCARDEFSSW